MPYLFMSYCVFYLLSFYIYVYIARLYFIGYNKLEITIKVRNLLL